MTPQAAVLIPAWNEATVIPRLLRRLAKASRDGQLRVIVIANGCTDTTAAVARNADPHALVLEVPEGGKANAMNLGYAAGPKGLPVVCLDADLVVDVEDILAMVLAVQRGTTQAACGQMIANLDASSWVVRAFYKAWALNPYFSKGKFGGMFALSAAGAARVFPLPKITADDEWVRRTFAPAERAYIPESKFHARAPRDLGTLIRLRRRSLRGARAVRAVVGQTEPEYSACAMLRQALSRPGFWPGMAVYIAVMLLVRLQLQFEPAATQTAWERDHGNRTPVVARK